MRTGDVTIFSVTHASVQDLSLPNHQRSTAASPNATLREAERIMVVCNACRYCEGYCAVFRAMEKRRSFPAGDLRYLANLCHDCGECLYACQYAPPHEFGINVPRTFAQLRLESYETYAWPTALSRAFRRNSGVTSLALAAAMVGGIWVLAITTGSIEPPLATADFYAILPHHVMVALFGVVFGFALTALGVGLARFRRDTGNPRSLAPGPNRLRQGYGGPPKPLAKVEGAGLLASVPAWRAVRDALTLRNLHAHGADCTYGGEELRSSLRRWFHHCTFYGFALCFAATSIAAIYHWLGWPAPDSYGSLPVVLGTAGGFGLLVGPAGLYSIGRLRDPAAANPAYRYLEHGLIVLLFLSSLTGLALLVFRETPAMAYLLIVHLGVVLALFLTLPYGKFVHGLYRTAALVKHARESTR
jgi:citrate/tricarballylate utilization protein